MPYKNKQDLYRYQVQRWIKIKKKAITYKGGKCEECGFKGHYSCFDFHHINPEEKDVSWTKLRLRAWSRITHELDKCQILCANCHRPKHSEN